MAWVPKVDANNLVEVNFGFGIRGSFISFFEGHVDILLNIAGGYTWGKVADTSLSEWEHMLRLNLTRQIVSYIRESPA